MIQLSQIRHTASSIASKGRVVYTSSIAAAKPTIMDAFKSQLTRKDIINKEIRAIRKEALKYLESSELALKNQLEKEGLKVFILRKLPNETPAQYLKRLESAKDADILISSRVKGQESNLAKMQKLINRMQNFDNISDPKTKEKYDESTKLINEFLSDNALKEKYKTLVGDELGLRLILNNETKNGQKISEKIIKSLKSLHSENKMKICSFENYHGENITPYTNEQEVFKYFNIADTQSPPVYSSMIKPFGYTRVNCDAKIRNVNAEIQFGGKLTTPIGDAEHVLYDKRSSKPIDITNYTKEQIQLARNIRKQYGKVLQNPQKDEIYNQYLPEIWRNARNAEINNNPFVTPALPEGFNPILSGENILKLGRRN